MAVSLHIAVVGAGLAGLATAIACAQEGHKVTVFESSKQLGEVGNGIALTPNAVRILFRWGLEEAVQAQATVPHSMAVSRYADGKLLISWDNMASQTRAAFGAPFINMHRADLHQLMLTRALAAGAEIRTAARVVDLNLAGARPSLILESGETATADLIVGADGLWSRCREVFLNRTDKPLPTGDLAYRTVLKLDDIADPQIRSLIQSGQVRFWIGPDMHCVGYAIRDCKMYNLVFLCPDDLPEDVARQPGSLEEMRKLFFGWDPFLTRLLDQVSSADKWKLLHRAELETWTSAAGNFALIGDSCHPMLPYLAQGASSSIEDGAFLGTLLRGITDKSQLPVRIKAWEAGRKPRGQAITRECFVQRDQIQMRDGPQQEERDKIFAHFLGRPITSDRFPNRLMCPSVQEWLYGYDAFQEAEAALAALT